MKILNRQPEEISQLWKTVKRNWVISLVNKFVVILTLISIAAIVWRWKLLPPLVPLWYSRPWGVDELAPPIFLFLLPMTSIIVYSINVVISIYLTSEYLIFTQVLFLSSLVVSLLTCITLIKILFLVT